MRMENQTIAKIALAGLLAFSVFSIINIAVNMFLTEKEVVVQHIVSEPETLIIEELPHTQDDLECLALNLYHEARNELDAGLYAVADVTQNRVADPRWPNTICDVVYEAKML